MGKGQNDRCVSHFMAPMAPRYTRWFVKDSVRGVPDLGITAEVPPKAAGRVTLNPKKMLRR